MFGLAFGRMGAVRGRAGAALPAPITNPRIALVGDSLTQYSNSSANLNAVTLSRDAAGLVAVPKAGHAIFGAQPISIVNTSDTSFEGLFTSQYVDANNFRYQTGVSGAAGSIVGGSLTQAVVQNRYQRIGYWPWLQGIFKGGLRFTANYGQGGDQLSNMGPAVTSAATSSADIVILSGGINDINGYAATAATVISRMQGHVDTLISAGKKVVILGITPLGLAFNNATKGQAIVDSNTGYAAIAASNPNNIKFANPHASLTDGANNYQAYSWATTDGIHWGQRAAEIVAQALSSSMSSLVDASNVLPTAAANFPVFDGFTCIKQYGPWDATGGGFAGTGYAPTGANSGVAPRLQIFSSNAATTYVPSLADRGDGTGYWQQAVVTAGGSSHDLTFYLASASGESLATLGVVSGDELFTAAEVQVTGGNAGNLLSMTAVVQSQSSGAYGIGDDSSGNASVVTNPDNFTTMLCTGRLKVTSSWTTVSQVIRVRVSAASAAPFTLRIGRIALYRKPA